MKNKIIIYSLIGLIFLSFLIWFFLFRISGTVYIDATRVLQEYSGAQVAREALELKTSHWKSNVDTLEAEFQNAYEEFERKEKGMDANIKEERRTELRKKQQQLEEYKGVMQQNAVAEDQKLSQETISDINKFLTEYGKKHRYKYILIANQVGTIAYAADGLDITDDVIKALNDAREK
ncbi:OmpH family outer membrane protein [Sphingobacterium olei]|uniref:OmpH family outer membrane protein n=1 Tax=Sphingobacterium olei TaxID=2571155 RepID=A0A4U0NTL1_9SPHI|nr:OmpH family outer membrane protein [Sphingobacterium olei]TJZ53574.1 OmpH family outer membrane protein [Sphingobacterium olei]